MKDLMLRRYLGTLICFPLVFLLLAPAVAFAIRLDLGSAGGPPGSDVTIPITLNYEGSAANLCGTSNDIGFNTSLLENPRAAIGPAGGAAEKMVLPSTPLAGVFRVGVIGINQNIIQNGIVAYVTFHVKAGVSVGNTSLSNSPSATDCPGSVVAVQGSQGTISVDTPPVATGQSVTTNKNSAKPITLTATDADGDTLTYSIVGGPAHGTLGTLTGASVTYTPTSNYTGSDSFTFKANDGFADSNTATVTIRVNALPVANSQSVTASKNTAEAITLGATDADGDTLTYSIVVNPSHGSLSGTPPNVTYTPTVNYTGSDSFTFKANDGNADSNVATVSIMVFNLEIIENTIYVSQDGRCNGNYPCYPNIQNGIATASVPSAVVMTGETYYEDVVLDFDETIFLDGGWRTDFTSIESYTIIDGFLKITRGRVIIEKVKIQ